jgi:signal transduction histidine kinase
MKWPSTTDGFSLDDLSPGRVLVVDDDPAVCRLVAKVLTGTGYAVDVASGTDEALDLLAVCQYDVALVDLEMPGRNGLDLLEAIAGSELAVVPILLTGMTDVQSAVSGMKQGAFDYLLKPAKPEVLRWTVARAVSVARTRCRERVLERGMAEWASTFDACPDLVLILDAAGRVLRANQAATCRVDGCSGGFVGRPVDELFTEGFGVAIAKSWIEHQIRGVVPATRVFDMIRGVYYLVTVNPICLPVGAAAGVIVVARDVSELVREKELRGRLYQQLLTAQEDERGRIARELHDGIGQSLVSLIVGLSTLTEAPSTSDLRDRLLRLGQVASETLDETRRMSQGLRPMVLDDLGLPAALARLTEGFTQLHGIRAELLLPNITDSRLPNEIESTVYRIVQEALANVAKHARARTVDVVLEVADQSVQVLVTDDGAGFDPCDPLGRQSGFGLSGMRERVVMLDGVFRLDSGTGRGTTIDIRIPIPEGVP